MDDRSTGLAPLDHLPTGVPGLDTILRGGILPGGVYIIQGGPGAGKTILANQICYNWAAAGQRSLYVTLLAESHHRLLRYLSKMAFFDASRAGDDIFYESGFDTLKQEGLDGILAFLRRNSRARDASLIVLDGLFVLEENAASERAFREFVNDLGVLADLADCSILLLTNSKRSSGSPEYTMVDGWFELELAETDYRACRFLRVHKFRGSDFIPARHAVTISEQGVQVYPRLETLPLARREGPPLSEARLGTGVEQLDALIGGGLPVGSTTLLIGPTGVGKTSLALHFLCAATPAEPALLLGLYEDKPRLLRRAASLGLPLAERLADGSVEILWHAATEVLLDEIVEEMLQAVRSRGVQRLVIDGLSALERVALHEGRLGRFLAALTNTLRSAGVTTLYTSELPQLIGTPSHVRLGSLSAVAENIVLMRYAERHHHLAKALSIMKMRDSDFSAAAHELRFGPQGASLGPPLDTTVLGHGLLFSVEDDG